MLAGDGSTPPSASWDSAWEGRLGQASIPEADVMEVVESATALRSDLETLMDLTGWSWEGGSFKLDPEQIPGKAVRKLADEFVDDVAGPGTSFFTGKLKGGVKGGVHPPHGSHSSLPAMLDAAGTHLLTLACPAGMCAQAL